MAVTGVAANRLELLQIADTYLAALGAMDKAMDGRSTWDGPRTKH